MTQMKLTKEHAPPLWAVLGAPLIGVPVMVALLALGAPKAEAPAVETVPAWVTEQVDTHVVESATGDSAAPLDQTASQG